MARLILVFGLACGLAVSGCVPPEQLTVLPAVLPNGAVGVYYSEPLSIEGEVQVRWAVTSGELPPGLSLNDNSGWISGTPTAAGEYSFSVTATGAGRGEAAYTITIHEQLQLGTLLNPGRVQEPFVGQIPVSGGVAPYSYSVIGLPAGIGYDQNTGIITGTPIYPVAGELLQVTVVDSGTPQQTVSGSVPLVIKPLPVSITTETLPDVVVGAIGYSQTIEAANGVPPYGWSIVEGNLAPLGLELVLTTGEIRNRRDALGLPVRIPADAAPSTFTVRVVDSDSPPTVATRQYTVGVIRPGQ